MKNRYSSGVMSAMLLALLSTAHAEDIDLYVQPPAGASADLPNVLFVLDNAAAFSANAENCKYTTDSSASAPTLNGTVGGVEQCALYNAFRSLVAGNNGVATMKIGLMVYNATNMRDFEGNNCGGTEGGCLAVPLLPADTGNIERIGNWIKSWRTSGGVGDGYIKANGEATGAAMQESWAYYTGNTGLSGRSYAGVRPSTTCNKNYIIFIGNAVGANGTPGDGGSRKPDDPLNGASSISGANASPSASVYEKLVISKSFATTCGNITFTDKASNHATQGLYADEWARYMYDTQNIISYGLGFVDPKSCKPDYPALLDSMATVSNGAYLEASDYSKLLKNISEVLTRIQAVNSAFASVSLPVSVNTQGSYLNQVYIGMFRPADSAMPKWFGNVKQYKIGYVDSTNTALTTLDAYNQAAIGTTGFIDACASSYWSPASLDTYWQFSPRGECTATNAKARYATLTGSTDLELKYSNFPDGNIVEKGGQAYKVRAVTPSTRTMLTCSLDFATCVSNKTLTDFSTSNTALTSTAAQSALGVATSADATALVKWQRGLDVDDEDYDGVTDAEIRASVHGDIVHSRPVALNFGTDSAPKIAVFYGGNDGLLHAINGDRDSGLNVGTIQPGRELWTFVPPEFYGSIKRLKDDSVPIKYQGSTTSGALPKPYGMDGVVAAYNDTSNAWIYASMRRGGRVMYAFDVSNTLSSPSSPAMKWKLGCPNNLISGSAADDTGCTTNASGLGQTWAAPKAIKTPGYTTGGTSPVAKPLLVFGGGYDLCEDYDNGTLNNNCTSSSKGRHIFVTDADTGEILKVLDTDRPVVADLAVVPDTTTGLAKYLYTTDLGGNIYRIDIGTGAPTTWGIQKIASLGCGTVSPCSSNRKFMFAPDIVYEGGAYILLLGSGDREKPLSSFVATTATSNYFFMVKDKPGDTSWLSSESSNCGDNIICLSSLTPVLTASSPSSASLASSKGWYLGLRAHEQVVTSAITVYGTVTFSTHIPTTEAAAGTCSADLGTASVYNIAYSDASASANRYATIQGGGLPPSPIAGNVILDSGITVPFVIGASSKSPLEATLPKAPTSITSRPKVRAYWYIKQ